ncbi:isoprenylcysteine carboxyl methyltransferase family protein [Priestia endophytica]|jgi:methyltransferase|uniref:15-methylpalmitoyl-4-hydroxy-2-pyrone 4-O-methyltransferase n=1 Tax=Priestia endophytica DSM 13796 TaxID=1121089 RepID=A0A1I5Y4S5_9BACI|nr:isoprenylcysteine carboxylmethyltransferase family protein [Priestia endophytica]KYG31562.1 isoprenylcysteine carboxyl methyltransferase [Priestia endophytica]MBG9811572.1 isoprenylcysteine carboxyl methyltransferase [Priestia endophytica]SFQ39179.1 15-methylpalmitoyl-4-hydroxy-2-pyrone 4-O-methyltransferase [Priestia endophytica DSM 13796]
MFLFLFLIVQRLAELFVAKRNERWMKEKGAIEHGQEHYPLMVVIHLLFFVSLGGEAFLWREFQGEVIGLLFILFVVVQVIRVWALVSLGRFWNTKILILKDANVVLKGPYKYIKHPNYFVVTCEFLLVPLILHAYATLVAFSLLNLCILSVRISAEEEALEKWTDYESAMENKGRFFFFRKRVNID